MNLFDELTRITKLNAYGATGDERYLKDMPPLPKFAEPSHLPQPLPVEPAQEFDVWDDQQMRDCVGRTLAKPVQALLQCLQTMKPGDYLYDELKALRAAVKEEWEAL